MVKGQLPDEGPARLGPVTLPAGRLITGYGGTDHVAWATVVPVPESGRVWAALSGLHPRTGLVPIQLDSLDADAGRPWDGGDFLEPQDPREADRLEAGAVHSAVAWPGRSGAHAADPGRTAARPGRGPAADQSRLRGGAGGAHRPGRRRPACRRPGRDRLGRSGQ